jgi:hypothetical protein
MRGACASVVLAVCVSGCSTTSDGVTSLGAGTEAMPMTGTDAGGTMDPAADTGTSSSAADDTSSTGSSDGPPPIFDLGATPDLGGPQGCEAVDFLFVIDDSLSMFEHQQNLVANFPAFIEGIQSTLVNVETYQVGVIATDAYPYNPGPCILMGALVTSTEDGGPESSDMICGPYAEGWSYMTEVDDLEQTFGCAAQVGTMGNGFERPMEAMVETVSRTLGDPGECNEGFIRDEALLVVVVITDEYDGEGDPEAANPTREPATSVGTPESWYDAVVAAKNDHPENAVALALVNYAGGPCPPSDLGHDGANIVAWVEQFGDNGFLGGICEPDYGPIFRQATSVIEDACASFVPAG